MVLRCLKLIGAGVRHLGDRWKEVYFWLHRRLHVCPRNMRTNAQKPVVSCEAS